MLLPNGTLTTERPHGYVWTTACRKCRTVQRIRLGNVTLDEARQAVAIIDPDVRECPGGFHVELGGWAMRWSLDLMLQHYEAALTPKAEPVGTFTPTLIGASQTSWAA